MRQVKYVFHVLGHINALALEMRDGTLQKVPVRWGVVKWLEANDMRSGMVLLHPKKRPGADAYRLHFVHNKWDQTFVCGDYSVVLCERDARRLLRLKRGTRRFTLYVQ